MLDGIAFGRADIAETVHEGDGVDVVARLTSRVFGGFESLQLDIRDVATSGGHPRSAAILAPTGASRSWPGASRDEPGVGTLVAAERVGRSLAGPGPVDRRPARSSRSSRSACSTATSRSSATTEGGGNGTGQRRRRRVTRDAGAVERRRRPARGRTFPGSIVYAKAGNIWVQTGKDVQAADDRRRRLDAVVVAGRPDDLLHPDHRRRSATGRPAGSCATTR